MAKKKEVYKVKPLNENKKNIIAALIDEYDIQTADDIQAALTVPRKRISAVHMVNFKLMFHKTETAPLSHRL